MSYAATAAVLTVMTGGMQQSLAAAGARFAGFLALVLVVAAAIALLVMTLQAVGRAGSDVDTGPGTGGADGR